MTVHISSQVELEINSHGKSLAYPGKVINTSGNGNKLSLEDKSFHDWYRFVLSFPPHLVNHYLKEFNISPGQIVLDPFCGTGTTLIQSKLNRIESVGIEANPFAHFASMVKANWDIDPDRLSEISKEIGNKSLKILHDQGIEDLMFFNPHEMPELRTLNDVEMGLILGNSISPLPLHKALVLRDEIDRYKDEKCYDHLRLALAKTLVHRISNLQFGPEVGVGKPRADAQVIYCWLSEVNGMVNDLKSLISKDYPNARAILADSRDIGNVLEPNSVDAVFTSPPYPNEKDYTRTTRLESVFLGFIQNKEDLRKFKKTLIRSNTRGVYKEDHDDAWIANNHEINSIADAIEKRRIELGKTSGFEKQYGKVTKLYFGGMARHLNDLKRYLKPGAYLGYVVGDQASYLRVMIRTGKLLAEIAHDLGYEVEQIDLFRNRFSTATKQNLREEVVVLRWKGDH